MEEADIIRQDKLYYGFKIRRQISRGRHIPTSLQLYI